MNSKRKEEVFDMIRSILTAMLILVGSTMVSAQRRSVNAYHDYAVECMGVEHDGSQTLRCTGRGRNKADAVEQAQKNAVRAVIFYGITDGRDGCNMRPLISEANAEEKYEEYFNIFFMDKGEYRKYVSAKDSKARSKTHSKSKTDCIYTVTTRVLRSELKARLKSDNVIK